MCDGQPWGDTYSGGDSGYDYIFIVIVAVVVVVFVVIVFFGVVFVVVVFV